jgi:site-specific DNA-methyltransferase (adenine-specific)
MMADDVTAPRRRTATSSFGVSGRESHDSSSFYERFRPPTISTTRDPALVDGPLESFVHGDARAMTQLPDDCVAMVVTSPPYFAGKTYEEELAADGVPSSYLEYLEMLAAVFAECTRVLEPGGRLCVNVANLGRKPYRSLAADVIRILEHDLGLLLRGEIVWQKGEGASGSCAWGSYRSASNPVLRDLTERVIVASKGRFDRGRSAKDRAARDLPHQSTVLADEFLAATLDVWSIPPESARRVGHPAPFPIELPEQLLRLYTFEGDLVLDPFMGSGSTLVAASRLRRRYVGYDLDQDFVALARRRVAEEGVPDVDRSPRAAHAREEGRGAVAIARAALAEVGFTILGEDVRLAKTPLTVPFVVADRTGRRYAIEVGGPHVTRRGGLSRPDAVLRTLGRATAMAGRLEEGTAIVLVTTELPEPGSEAEQLLRAAPPALLVDVIDLLDDDAVARLASLAAGDAEVGR